MELHDAVVPGVRPPSILRSLGKLESDYTVWADFSDIHWFNTIKVSRQALEASLGPAKVDTRARNLYLLGMSMSPLFDISNASDFVRALLKLLDDWEAAIVEGGKGVVRRSSRLNSARTHRSWIVLTAENIVQQAQPEKVDVGPPARAVRERL